MYEAGEVISYIDMCLAEGTSLQRGMNFRLNQGHSVILMSVRPGAPYNDRLEDDGKILIYEGHDISRARGSSEPKAVDQPLSFPSGKPTQNGWFFAAAQAYKDGSKPAESVRVYEKIRPGIWVYNGVFTLVDSWLEHDGKRKVVRFKLRLETDQTGTMLSEEIAHTRFIPTNVKLEVWKRDKGRCVICGSDQNLHFDHIIPFSKGGTSLTAENIQLLCARHNLEKHDRIE